MSLVGGGGRGQGAGAAIDTAVLRKLARSYRNAEAKAGHALPEDGFVMIYEGSATGWSLDPPPLHFCPDVFAVPVTGNIKRAIGGDCQRGAKSWEVLL